MNLSLDGYIAAQGADDGSWLSIDDEVHGAFNQLAAGAAAFLYGRKVYEVMIPYWPDAVADATKPAHEREYARLWVDKPKVVVSTTLKETRCGLVDEYALFVHPSALGAGVPFFRGRVDLTLVDVRRFERGTLGLRYASTSAKGEGGLQGETKLGAEHDLADG